MCLDAAGPAAVIGPRTVVMGDNVTLNCSVADPGYLRLHKFITLSVYKLQFYKFTKHCVESLIALAFFLQCFNAVGWAAGRASGL